jgi:putative ABC transport system permease protein
MHTDTVSIARASLIHEWRRYLAAVLAVTFAGLLVVVQLALLFGLFATVSVAVDTSKADLWIGFRNTQSVDLGRTIPAGSDALAWAHPGVERIERYSILFGDLRRADGVPMSVVVNAIDVAPDALAFAQLLSPAQGAALRTPGALLIDAADTGKLDAKVGSAMEINGKRVRIAGTVEGLRAIGGVNAIVSYATARALAPDSASETTYYLLTVRRGYDPGQVALELADQRPVARYSVWHAPRFSAESQIYWLLESGAGIGSGFASLLALIVGVVIASQTLSGAILASIKEFAALRALGVSRRSLRAVVAEQALWVGVAGLSVTAVLTVVMAWLGETLRIAMQFPWWMLGGVAVLMLGIAMLSGLLALRPLLAAEPASLLR